MNVLAPVTIRILLALIGLKITFAASGAQTLEAPVTPIATKNELIENWNFHFQATYLKQRKEAFNAPYTGTNSLLTH